MTTPIKIAELQRLDAAATPGPWVHQASNVPLQESPSGSWRRVCRTSPMQTVFAADEGHDRVVTNAEAIAAMRNALPALIRLARAADRYAWMLSKDGPAEVDDAIVAEWIAARAAFDFTTEEPSA